MRFVQIFEGGWDSHDYLERAHSARIRSIDQPIAALITDLQARGLLDETLVIWGGEFGRSPDNGVRGGQNVAGRDHNTKAMAIWLAGGGVRAGQSSAPPTSWARKPSKPSTTSKTCTARSCTCSAWTTTSSRTSTKAATNNSAKPAAA